MFTTPPRRSGRASQVGSVRGRAERTSAQPAPGPGARNRSSWRCIGGGMSRQRMSLAQAGTPRWTGLLSRLFSCDSRPSWSQRRCRKTNHCDMPIYSAISAAPGPDPPGPSKRPCIASRTPPGAQGVRRCPSTRSSCVTASATNTLSTENHERCRSSLVSSERFYAITRNGPGGTASFTPLRDRRTQPPSPSFVPIHTVMKTSGMNHTASSLSRAALLNSWTHDASPRLTTSASGDAA